MKTDYLVHETMYRELREQGHAGWGGEAHARRMRGWADRSRELAAHPAFPVPPAPILEVGCGAGDTLLAWAERGHRVSGIDIAPTAVAWAEEKFAAAGARGEFRAGSVGDLGQIYPASSFDVVVDGDCFHCLIGEDRARFLIGLHQVLRPGGLFVLSHMVNEVRDPEMRAELDPRTRVRSRDGVAYRFMPYAVDLLGEVESAGFEILEHAVRENPWWDHLQALARKR